ncbi:uncharacterized protein CEXT_512841 [Caerostris extrusa]|uniref:Uncharacterized protein n=1 Tax=Caerostris extrusa TaxID=172846 RepID=A0AAV4XFD2_CAEEX|nr:uncharacterized protein CEXT_512841 [Caerostris extrusa]
MFELQPNVIFQQDSTSPHWRSDVRRSLDKNIGRHGPNAWPSQSPDIPTLCVDIYATSVLAACDLRHRITEAINSVTPDMRLNRWTKIEHRLDNLRATNVAHIEVYTYTKINVSQKNKLVVLILMISQTVNP